MVNALQIISALPLFNVAMPANALSFFEFISDCASFNVIDFGPIYRLLGIEQPE
jgi:hypothetical protein